MSATYKVTTKKMVSETKWKVESVAEFDNEFKTMDDFLIKTRVYFVNQMNSPSIYYKPVSITGSHKGRILMLFQIRKL